MKHQKLNSGRMKSNTTPQMLRKGAWTKEEDSLLLKCIEKYGEVKWHQVPQRAGLNRCRKSCRLRWLNYLRPNIKRGDFDEDEVDLLLRLHKLLGNRWSLIAGRLPGRTGNNVKNYWNTHIQKKLHIISKEEAGQKKEEKKDNQQERGVEPEEDEEQQLAKDESTPQSYTVGNIVKPQPRTFSNNNTITREVVYNISPKNNNNNNTSSLLMGDGGILLKEELDHQTWSDDILQELLGYINSDDSTINYKPPQLLQTMLNDDESNLCKHIWDL